MQFSTNLQLCKIIHCMYSTMDSQLNFPPFQIVFSPIPQVIYMGRLVGGGGEPRSGGLNDASCVYTSHGPQLSPNVAPNVTKVAKSLDNITSQPCVDLQPRPASLTVSRVLYRQPGQSLTSDTAHKPAPGKADRTVLGIDAHMNCQCIDVAIEW